MSEAAVESSPVKMEVAEDVSNGLKDEPMDTEEAKKSPPKKRESPSSEDPKPEKISKKPRKSSSSVSSDKSGSHDNGEEEEQTKSPVPEEEEDFLGFPLPIDTSLRDRFQKFLRNLEKEGEGAVTEDDVQSISDTNEESDSAAESTSSKTKPSLTKKAAATDNDVTKKVVSTDSDLTKKVAAADSDFKKPFELGWVREVVYRSQANPGGRRRADIYYYTPSGKKVRSSQEIADHLSGDLTIEDFSFVMKPVGINDPAKEIIREAGRPSGKVDEVSSQHKPALPTIKPKPKSISESRAKSPSTMKVAMKWPNKKPAPGKKIEVSRKTAGSRADPEDSSEDTGWDMVQKIPTREVCSIECRLAMGLIPSLQCASCCCLYHPECVGVQQDKLSPSKPYSCKNCQTVSDEQNNQPKNQSVGPTAPPPPPLIPMESQNQNSANYSRKSAAKPERPMGSANRQNIVGTVTTWLPSSSSIQVSQSSPTPKTSTISTTMTTAPTSLTKPSIPDGPHQGLLQIGGNTFVVIPRHNVVNVSNQTTAAPAVAATANTVNPSQTQTNGILLVPLSVPPPDSTLADVSTTVHNPVAKSVNPGSNVEANGIKPRSSDSSVEDEAPKNNVKLKEIPPKYLPNQFFALSEATTMSLFSFFQYLKVHELLRATQVNKTWHLIATHQSLWETVRMKNSKVRDFEGFGNALRKYNTKSLDLRKMIVPESPEATNEMWTELGSVISTLPNLRRVDFGRCSPSAIEVVAAKCPHLESITSLSIRGTDLNMSEIANCTNLVELKLKSFGGIDIKNIASLKLLKNLKTLVLTSVKNLEGVENALPESLEALELGECVKLTDRFAVNALPKLTNLKRLRLERGQGSNCPTLAMLHTISTLPNLSQLELINFDIKPGFDKALSKCTNVKVLLIIPTYVTQSATTNHVVMGGVSKLSSSLQYFIWGLTLELLRVTDLFIDQVEGGKAKSGAGAAGKKAGTGDSIPILKPISEEGADANREGSASQVDILGLPKLQRVLSTLLPQTKIKILKIPFSATWRQTVTDVPA